MKPLLLAIAITLAVSGCATTTSPTGRTQYVARCRSSNSTSGRAGLRGNERRNHRPDLSAGRATCVAWWMPLYGNSGNAQGGWESAVFVDTEPQRI